MKKERIPPHLLAPGEKNVLFTSLPVGGLDLGSVRNRPDVAVVAEGGSADRRQKGRDLAIPAWSAQLRFAQRLER
jgi:hypothetical protein